MFLNGFRTDYTVKVLERKMQTACPICTHPAQSMVVFFITKLSISKINGTLNDLKFNHYKQQYSCIAQNDETQSMMDEIQIKRNGIYNHK